MSEALNNLHTAYINLCLAEQELYEAKQELGKSLFAFCIDEDGLDEGLCTNDEGFIAYKHIVDFSESEATNVALFDIEEKRMALVQKSKG
jgi:hypothetical protein